ncbi:MAG: AraC family transcriptional regulator [Proteobacteria bacterium]|nr:AraC family transcriptional regulator [Pseudomonadota bacterium]
MIGTTLSSWILLVAKGLEDYGVDYRPLFRQAGLDPELLKDPNARYQYTAIARLFHLAADATGDECFGLKASKHWHPTTLHALGYAWLASHSLKEAFERLERYLKIVSNVAKLYFKQEKDTYTLRFGDVLPRHDGIEHPAQLDLAFAVLVRMCRTSCDGKFNPLQVEITHAQPACHAEFETHFGCPVIFNAKHDQVVMDAKSVEAALPTGNTELARVNDEVVTRYIANMDRSDIVTQVKVTITDSLPSGHVTEDHIAGRLNLSRRSLQRKLREQSTSYRELLENTRKELAGQYMADKSYSISEITYLLGFSDPSNFNRAFRRWKGVSPSAYRNRPHATPTAGLFQ